LKHIYTFDVHIYTDRMPPHVPVPLTITVATPVGWTWDIYTVRTPPHVPATITVAAPVGGTWYTYMDRQPFYALSYWVQI
ncbi:hypothetical protein AVEN_263935-1, partial [Araneus ventricosus]